jgi:DNA-binding NarL/FixJ family response regulator
VQRGESCVYPSLADRFTGVAVHPHAKPGRFSGLTAREEQILDCLARGLSNKQIGRELELSERTIKNYVSTLLEKLQVRNRVEAALLGKSRLSSGREA